MSNPTAKGCHNCRRRRLRCDRSVPTCLKCSANGDECLGYGTLLRWTNVPAVKGKLASQLRSKPPSKQTPLTPSPEPVVKSEAETEEDIISDDQSLVISHIKRAESPASSRPDLESGFTLLPGLLDPLFDQTSSISRCYIRHFSTTVCRDLVSIDQDTHNPFRIMVPLIQQYKYLQAIVVATSAMHLATMRRYHGLPAQQETVDAFAAKGKAIRLLRAAIENATPGNQTTILAAIVFFVNLDLIDSGKGVWETHVKAAETLISSLHRQTRGGQKLNREESSLAPLADVIAADCLTYRILGSTITGHAVEGFGDQHPIDVLSVLQRAQAHSYHCCPPTIMQTILHASQLCAHGSKLETGNDDNSLTLRSMLASLFARAREVDVEGWVHSIQGLSPEDDLNARVSIASAHRAAACLYIALIMPAPDGGEPVSISPIYDELVAQILQNLSNVPIEHVLLKGTVWPTFMAGAQTDNLGWREDCLKRLDAVWTTNTHVCPWGYVRTAMEMLQQIWRSKEADYEGKGRGNWLHQLRNSGGSALIV
ncbi:fungal-specific transcription factor domain-containing protein [Cercophora newfieldiana]|uniref:Fungal-specific transcription factor domain-containing protein n=1 Tax=Cercophora newfieldiana TaxID=92897 RepID=A0AA39Y9X5_9PEZI|nr:fungal-specific transcription factor domain-containing protein [Cercophora newfieldiana]